MGRHTSRIKIEDIPTEAEVAWMVVALLRGRDDNVTVLQITHAHEQHFAGQKGELVVQAAPQVLETMPDGLFVDGGQPLKIVIEGRKLRCFKYGRKAHLSSGCGPKTDEKSKSVETQKSPI